MIERTLSRVSVSERRTKLAVRLREKRLLSAPGVFEMVSAKMADRMGFEALYMTGYGTVASYLGLPDAGLASYADMVNRVQQFASITATPMICDADTGYGGLLNVMHTVRGYEAAGACAIQLEDQEFPKKCGHMLGRRVIPAQAMADKIRVAVESRSDPNFLVIARTDARTTLGLDEALRRAALCQSRCRPLVHREPGIGRRDGTHRPQLRSAAGGQYGRRRSHASPHTR